MSYENKILQMKKLLQKKANQETKRPVFKMPERPNYVSAWEAAGLELVENDFGVLVRQCRNSNSCSFNTFCDCVTSVK